LCVQIIIEQGVQECDATKPNAYSTVWPKKFFSFTIDDYHSRNYSLLKLLTGLANAAFID